MRCVDGGAVHLSVLHIWEFEHISLFLLFELIFLVLLLCHNSLYGYPRIQFFFILNVGH